MSAGMKKLENGSWYVIHLNPNDSSIYISVAVNEVPFNLITESEGGNA